MIILFENLHNLILLIKKKHFEVQSFKTMKMKKIKNKKYFTLFLLVCSIVWD
jgi:hypothetical protein